MTKASLIALTIFGSSAIAVSGGVAFHRSRLDVAEALKRAGYKPDNAGRIPFKDRSFGGVTLAYDPSLKNPTIGLRNCIRGIDSCQMADKQLDRCVQDAPRCVSATPWNNDPAGEDCCPESCVSEYFNNRKTQKPGAALSNVVDGMCYPGLQAFLSRGRSDGGAP